MQPILTALPTLTVSALYCVWQLYALARRQHERRLRKRVAYMLWVMANEVD